MSEEIKNKAQIRGRKDRSSVVPSKLKKKHSDDYHVLRDNPSRKTSSQWQLSLSNNFFLQAFARETDIWWSQDGFNVT